MVGPESARPERTPFEGRCAGTDLQIFDALDAATEAALRASIEKHGVLVPIAVDQNDRILDGHHRSRIALELDVPFDTITHWVAGDVEAKEIARTLNEDRRQLPVVVRRQIETDLREQGHSQRAIAGAVGVSRATVRKDLEGGHLVPTLPTEDLEKVGESAQVSPVGPVTQVTPERVKGLDGKSYPAKRPEMPPLPPDEAERRRVESRKVQAHLNLTNALIPLNPDPIESELYAQRFADALDERLAEFAPEKLEKAAVVLLALAEIRRSM